MGRHLHALEPPPNPEDLARSAADAPRMGGLALVKSGDEVLRQGPHHQRGGRRGGGGEEIGTREMVGNPTPFFLEVGVENGWK